MRPYLDFLSALSENNHKDWMDANKKWYLDTKATLVEDVEVLLKTMVDLEPDLASFKAKDCLFRQNRDVRFSANKNPYKTNFGVYFSPGGKKSPGPGYYLQIQPGNSFLAGGIWMPEADTLKKIRKEIDFSGAELEGIVENPDFKKLFPSLEGEKLKTCPRDYDASHPYLEYLKLKSFTVSHPISDKAVGNGEFLSLALHGFFQMKPLIDFLGQALEEVEDGSGIL
ncbi:MAG: DUF2461 domain-containing protein [Bacteroidota bacterium]|jgi:uncharacterized protein (TIGR02453 family)|nr:DUF2461 domain-containing protein [Algoriphagus sp.]